MKSHEFITEAVKIYKRSPVYKPGAGNLYVKQVFGKAPAAQTGEYVVFAHQLSPDKQWIQTVYGDTFVSMDEAVAYLQTLPGGEVYQIVDRAAKMIKPVAVKKNLSAIASRNFTKAHGSAGSYNER